MVLDARRWMGPRRFRALFESGASVTEIARQTGLNRRTVKKYLAADAPPAPPVRVSPQRGVRAVAAFAHVIDGWLRADLLLKGTVIHERLVEQYGFTGHYPRAKLLLQEARPRLAAAMGIGPAEPAWLHRRDPGCSERQC